MCVRVRLVVAWSLGVVLAVLTPAGAAELILNTQDFAPFNYEVGGVVAGESVVRCIELGAEDYLPKPFNPTLLRARVGASLDNPLSMFVTLFFGMLDVISGELHFCNAGHNVPYVVAPGRVVPLHGARAKPVGIRPTLTYATTTKLAPGECLFPFTDGITESMNRAGAFFSEERLEGALASLAGQAPRAIVEAVLAAVREFWAAAPQSDDIAAVALRRVT